MKRSMLVAGLGLTLFAAHPARSATTIISDDYNVTTTSTGFALNNGVNFGINPPTTRLVGSTIANIRYLQTYTNRLGSHYDINSSRLRVTMDGEIGRFTLSANGSTPFDFGPALGVAGATAASPVVYDVKINMRNDATGNARFSLGIATTEGDINNMDFAVQLYRANSADTFYTIQKRIDRGSFNGTTSTDGTGDINAVMTTTGAGTAATMISFLIRVTDAGAESGANYNSRIQVSLNNGSSWIYDTATDSGLPNGFRFDGSGRYFNFDQAPNNSGNVFYDAFSVTWNSGPRTWTGAGANGTWNNATNWGGAVPVAGSALYLNGATRQTNTNDFSGLAFPSLTFNNGGFSVYGNALTVSSAITNITGNSALNAPLTLAADLRIQPAAGTLTLGGNISGTGNLTKEGTGVLELAGGSANTYSGSTMVNDGTLSLAKTAGINAIPGNVTVGDGAGSDVVQLAAANQIPDSAVVTISSSGSLDLNGFNETVASVGSSSASSQILLGTGTLSTGDAGASTFSGVISGTGGVVKQGSGILTLTGANTYSGPTTINVGKVTIGSGGSIGSSSTIKIASGATLDVSAVTFTIGASQTLSGISTYGSAVIDGNVTFASGANFVAQVNGGGSLVGKFSIGGNITLNGNTVTVNVTGGALGVGNYALITFTGTRSGTFNTIPVITGSGLGTGLAARIQHTSGVVSLVVYDPSATNTTFKVMQYNIHFATHDGVVDTTDTSTYIVNQGIDLVSMNEVDRFRDRTGNRDLPAEYAQKTGMTCVFSNNNTALTGNDEFGNAILSKYPVLYRERILLPKVGDNEQRGLLKTVVDVKGKFLCFWSTHLDFHADDTERLKCVTNFNKWVTNETFPVIICGDFNDSPGGAAPLLMEDEWNDCWDIAGDGTLGRTVPCPGPTVARIDYIWKVKGSTLTPTNAFVALSLEESDHYGVVTKFHLNITTNRSSGFYFRFDEGSGTNVLDSMGGLKGTMDTGAPTWSSSSPSGLPGDSSLFFNGSKKLMIEDTKQSIGTNGVNDNYTLQAWVKVAVNYAPTERAILFQYDRKPGFSISINTNRTLHTTAFKILDIPSTATLPNDGQWHHVAVVHTDGVNMKFYIDGNLSATVAYTGGAGYRTSSFITVGADSTGANPFTGYLSRIKFDNRALTPAQFDFIAAPPQSRSAPPTTDPFESWKATFGITDGNADADGDGQNNYAEYMAHTNPTNAVSVLRFVQGKSQSNGQVTLTWSSVGGVRYRIQTSDRIDGEFTDVVRDAAVEIDPSGTDQSSIQTYTDNESATNAARYYRVKVVP